MPLRWPWYKAEEEPKSPFNPPWSISNVKVSMYCKFDDASLAQGDPAFVGRGIKVIHNPLHIPRVGETLDITQLGRLKGEGDDDLRKHMPVGWPVPYEDAIVVSVSYDWYVSHYPDYDAALRVDSLSVYVGLRMEGLEEPPKKEEKILT